MGFHEKALQSDIIVPTLKILENLKKKSDKDVVLLQLIFLRLSTGMYLSVASGVKLRFATVVKSLLMYFCNDAGNVGRDNSVNLKVSHAQISNFVRQ